MIIVVYDAYNGQPISDGKALELAKVLLTLSETQDGEHIFSYSTENVFVAIRCLIAEKEFSPKNIRFLFEDKTLVIYSNGQLSQYPKGFIDFVTDLTLRALQGSKSKL